MRAEGDRPTSGEFAVTSGLVLGLILDITKKTSWRCQTRAT